MATATPKIYVASATFVAEIDGTEHYVHAGERLRADHPVVKTHPDFFREREDTD